MKRPKNISSILVKGDPMTRISILANHIGQVQLGGKGFLTDIEKLKLENSFRSSQDIQLYNKFANLDEKVRNALVYLDHLTQTYLGTIAKIRGFCCLLESYHLQVGLLNEILFAIEDKKANSKVLSIIEKRRTILAHFEIAEDGFVDLVIDRPSQNSKDSHSKNSSHTLENVLAKLSKRASKQLKDAKVALVVIREFLLEKDFKVGAYNYYLKQIELKLRKRPSKPLSTTGYFPDYQGSELDEEEKANFKRDFLN